MKLEREKSENGSYRVLITECDCGWEGGESYSWATHWRTSCPLNPANDDDPEGEPA